MSKGALHTISILTANGVVDAEAMETGVPGLVLVRAPGMDRWQLMHAASGLVVSRSARHHDPAVLIDLAHRLAPLADWTRHEVPVPGPVLGRRIERAVEASGLPLQSRWRAPSPSKPDTSASDHDTIRMEVRPQEVPGRLAVTERERDLLARILRGLHTVVSPATFAAVIGDLDAEERALVRALLTDGQADAPTLVQALPPKEADTQPVPVPRPPEGDSRSVAS